MKQAEREIDALTQLPEPLIHHIQSFLTGREAVRTSYLSKSWYDAWLTRPTLSFDEHDLKNGADFEKISTKSMERYQAMNLRIQSFNFRTRRNTVDIGSLAEKLSADAIKIGATDLNIEMPMFTYKFVLPPEVLGSKTLVRLCLRGATIAEGNVIRCSRLKSLVLGGVRSISDDIVRDIISLSSTSIEELSLYYCTYYVYPHPTKIELSGPLFELHKLRRLNLKSILVGESFFSDFASRFPCLKDLTLDHCTGYTRIQIASTSLEHIRFLGLIMEDLNAEFDVPNIRKFVYTTLYNLSLPSLRFKTCSRKWESHISITLCNLMNCSISWLIRLGNLLTNSRESSISLSISIYRPITVDNDWESPIDIIATTKPVVVENLTIAAPAPSIHAPTSSFLDGLFRVCRPTFIHYTWNRWGDLLDIYKTLKQKLDTPNLSTQFDLNVEFYDEFLREWRPNYEFTKQLAANDSTIDDHPLCEKCKPKIRFHVSTQLTQDPLF